MKFQSRVGQDAPAASGWSVYGPVFEPLEARQLLSGGSAGAYVSYDPFEAPATVAPATLGEADSRVDPLAGDTGPTAGVTVNALAGQIGAQATIDLTINVTTGTSVLSEHVTGSTRTNAGTVVVNVSNTSGTPVAANVSVGIGIYARYIGAIDDTGDILLNTKAAFIKGSSLGAFKTVKLAVPIKYPNTLPAGTFDIVLKADINGVVEETNESNNASVWPASIGVTDPFIDLTPAILSTSVIPSALTSGDGTKTTLRVAITNGGNVATAKTAKIAATVTAVPVGGGAGVLLGTFNLGVGAIGAKATRNVLISPLFPPGVASGDYKLRVDIDTADAIAETGGEANNSVLSDQVIAVTEGTVDLAPVILGNTVAGAIVSGTGKAKATVKVSITNTGNVNLPKGQTATVTVSLRPKNGGLGEIGALADDDLVIGTGKAVLGLLKPNTPRSIVIKTPVPSNLPDGEFELVVNVTPVQPLSEVDPVNEVTGASLEVAAAFTDVAIDPITNPFSAAGIEGTAKTVTATVRNSGNVAAKGVMAVQYFATKTGSLDGSEVAVSNVIQKTVNLGPNGASAFAGLVTLPQVFDDTQYTLIAKMTFTPAAGQPAPVSPTDTRTVGVINVQATPPTVGDLFGTISFNAETNYIDATFNPGIGRTGQVTQFGTLTTSTGLSSSFAYVITYAAGKIQNATINLQIQSGAIAGIGKTLQSTANFLLSFPTAGGVPLSLISKTMTFSDTKPATFQARANGTNILVSGDFYDKNDLYVKIA